MNSLFSRKVFSWLLVFIFFIVFINLPRIRDFYLISNARNLLAVSVYPFQYGARAFSSLVSSKVIKVATLFKASRQNDQLKNELALLRAKLLVADQVVAENIKLNAALKFLQANPYKLNLLPARVVARGGSNLYSTVLINRGSRHGVVKDSAVIAEKGLVGKVEEVYPFSARVLLIIDPASSVSSKDRLTGDFGVVFGRGLLSLAMRYVHAASKVAVGDEVYTSGMSDIYPAGIPIGKISKAEKKDYDVFQVVEVVPRVDFSRLELLFVVLKTKGS